MVRSRRRAVVVVVFCEGTLRSFKCASFVSRLNLVNFHFLKFREIARFQFHKNAEGL